MVNLKRIRRLCREHGLLLKQKRRRKRRGIGIGVPCLAEYPNHVWAYDFVEDRTETGRKLRVLTVADEFTRECVTMEVEYRMNAKFVAETLLRLFAEHGAPRFVRSDNGPEFIAKHLMRTLAGSGVEARHIEPGSPWQNGRNERFNGTLRDECLNLETFHNRDHARMIASCLGEATTSGGRTAVWDIKRRWSLPNPGCASKGATVIIAAGCNAVRGLCPQAAGIYRLVRPRLWQERKKGRCRGPTRQP